MSPLSRPFCVVALLGSLAPLAQAQASLNLGASLLVLPVLQIVDQNAASGLGAGLCFGDILPGTTTGKVIVSHTAAGHQRVKTGGVTLATYSTIGTPRAAAFLVTASGNAAVAFSYPSTTVTLTGPGGATMSVGNWVVSDALTQTTPVTNNPLLVSVQNGVNTFYVGATLNVGANQAPGDYAGTFSVSVNYN